MTAEAGFWDRLRGTFELYADGDSESARIRAERPDVVVMDVAMPELNGIEATRRLSGLQAGSPCTPGASTRSGSSAPATTRAK